MSEVGAPHLVDPSRLERSARRLYGDDFDRLWGPLLPVPEENVRIVGDRVLDLEVFPTPGHASHHVSYLAADGSCFTGDAAGRAHPAGRLRRARRAAARHRRRGVGADARRDRRAARRSGSCWRTSASPTTRITISPSSAPALRIWAERARDGSEEEFVAAAEADVRAAADSATAALFQQAGPLWQSYAGLRRYWDKKGEAAAA